MLWSIWKHCNEVVFKGRAVLADGVQHNVFLGGRGVGLFHVCGGVCRVGGGAHMESRLINQIHINRVCEFTDLW